MVDGRSRYELPLIILAALLTAVGCLSSCQARPAPPLPPPAASQTDQVTPPAEAKATAGLAAATAPAALGGRTSYGIAASLDYDRRRVLVDQRILIPHPSQQVLSQIVLVVAPNQWPGVFSIQDLRSPDAPLDSHTLSGVRLTIHFTDPGWMPGESLELEIQYTLDLPMLDPQSGSGPFAFGYSGRQINLVDWYPMVPPYQEDLGWLVHPPGDVGEYLVYPAADFEVSFDPGSPELVVAASTVPVGAARPNHYVLERGRNFVLSISPLYQVMEKDVGGIKIREYFFPGYQDSARAVLNAGGDAWTLYRELYGPNDQALLSIIQADFPDGLEAEGAFFLGKGYYDSYPGSEKSYLVAIAVHETAHQWWYGQVANDQALEPWLDEALCTFSELVYYENLHPDSAAWWWTFRVRSFQPVGDLEGSIYSFRDHENEYLMYRNATYLRGVEFLDDLRAEMGEEDFYAFLREYGAVFKDKIASGDEFFKLLGGYLDLGSQDWLEGYFPSRFGLP